jgi:predicted phosphodiesterase
MTRIGLISDTHNFLDDAVFAHFESCNEIWHGGDFGSVAIANSLVEKTGLPLRGVYGNIDGHDVRSVYPEKLVWNCEDVTVFMTHIGGYPGRYAPGVKQALIDKGAKLFISGHFAYTESSVRRKNRLSAHEPRSGRQTRLAQSSNAAAVQH